MDEAVCARLCKVARKIQMTQERENTAPPSKNGRLEVTWRIYNALCNITLADLTVEQQSMIAIERAFAYERYKFEGNLYIRRMDGMRNDAT